MQSLILIRHKWNSGAYSIEQMIDLVKNDNLTKQDFFNITRYKFESVCHLKDS